jgi:hypothetical protein
MSVNECKCDESIIKDGGGGACVPVLRLQVSLERLQQHVVTHNRSK